mmetsp:Transcript_30780/g.64275  ORF Transcript_30780/g.64275 Transcript_30780/m.64275 type:complete len:125 (-) Transcript_30780:72-446(-)
MTHPHQHLIRIVHHLPTRHALQTGHHADSAILLLHARIVDRLGEHGTALGIFLRAELEDAFRGVEEGGDLISQEEGSDEGGGGGGLGGAEEAGGTRGGRAGGEGAGQGAACADAGGEATGRRGG